jgi:hypothetical protein
MKVPHDLFKLTTADENGGLGEVWAPIVGPLSPEQRQI